MSGILHGDLISLDYATNDDGTQQYDISQRDYFGQPWVPTLAKMQHDSKKMKNNYLRKKFKKNKYASTNKAATQIHGNVYAEQAKKASEKQKKCKQKFQLLTRKIKTIFNMTWVLKPSESGD